MSKKGENIHKRKDGRWEARIPYNGKYKSIYANTYKEAKLKKQEFVTKKLVKSKRNLNDLLDDWLYYIKPEVKVTTYVKYEFIVNKHIRKEIGDIKLCNLNNEVIDNFTRDKLNQGNLCSKKGLSAKTVNGILSIIKCAIKYGSNHGYNEIPDLTIHNPKIHTNTIKVFTVLEQQKLEIALQNTKKDYAIGVILSLYTGLRIGEVCALTWDDIDLDSGIINVKRTITRIQSKKANKKTEIIIDKPKTDNSFRSIPISDFLINYLKTKQKENKKYVISGTTKYIEPRLYYHFYKNILKKCELEEYNYHALRHTFATRCIESGFDPKSLSEILGHSNVEITLRRYVHPTVDMKKKQMNLLKSDILSGQISGQ